MNQYPRIIMRKTELEKMGFAKEYLERIHREIGAPVAWKINPGSKRGNSPILFNTQELEKVIARGI